MGVNLAQDGRGPQEGTKDKRHGLQCMSETGHENSKKSRDKCSANGFKGVKKLSCTVELNGHQLS